MERESPLIYSFSIRQFIWEYISGKEKSTYIFSFSIRQYFREYIVKNHGAKLYL